MKTISTEIKTPPCEMSVVYYEGTKNEIRLKVLSVVYTTCQDNTDTYINITYLTEVDYNEGTIYDIIDDMREDRPDRIIYG